LYAVFETFIMNISQSRATAIKAMGGVVMRKLFFPTVCTTARSGVVATAVLWTACRYVAYQKDWVHAALIFVFMAIGAWWEQRNITRTQSTTDLPVPPPLLGPVALQVTLCTPRNPPRARIGICIRFGFGMGASGRSAGCTWARSTTQNTRWPRCFDTAFGRQMGSKTRKQNTGRVSRVQHHPAAFSSKMARSDPPSVGSPIPSVRWSFVT
jgi:hypothetical protein